MGERESQAVGDEQLLERDDTLSVLLELFSSVARSRRGQIAAVAGEAGIGKTTLVQAFCAEVRPVRVLAGASAPLHTPRTLGPLLDIAAETGGELSAVVDGVGSPGDVAAALLDELRRRGPTVVVLEDLHWADEATLDVLRLLARRLGTVPALVVVTYRDDELERHHPLRVALGELPQPVVTRIALAPLTLAAVAQLAEPHGVEAVELHSRTAGNPFYVTEALAAGGAAVPDSVRDAVLARAARLGAGARALLDAVAIAPPQAELWLLEALADRDLSHLEECVASGMLRTRSDTMTFRHEIARVAVEETLPPDRALALHRTALAALIERPGVDPARLAHHAEAADDGAAVLRYAVAAGDRAAAHGGHREAAAQYGRALRFAGALSSEARAELLEQHSYECYLTATIDDAIQSRRLALAEHRARGDVRREGAARRWLSRLLWYAGDRANAEDEGCLAVHQLERLASGPELAMAYSNMAQLGMLAGDVPGTRAWGSRAIELAERLGETEILVHALNNVGSAEARNGLSEGRAKLARSLELARSAGLEDDVARAHTNLAATAVTMRNYKLADRHIREGVEYCTERDLDSYRLYMIGWDARSQLDRGRWSVALATAHELLEHEGLAAHVRIAPLVVAGLVHARRGDGDPWGALDEALELAEWTDELQRLGPVAAARAEASWLGGEPERVAAETERAFLLALERRDAWVLGELSAWRSRAGSNEHMSASLAANPFRLELEGKPEQASLLWRTFGCPYESALALAASSDEAMLRRSLDAFQRLGAQRAARLVASALRARGARDIVRGPRASTRKNPAGLTTRELEVLELVAAGLRNAHIAERLVLSGKTVDHHVSAILRKLKASTRTEAAAHATRLGLLER